jgi:hypothetical protein
MSLILDLPQETEVALSERARREGTNLSQLVQRILEKAALEKEIFYDADGDPGGDPDALAKAMSRFRARTPEELAADRESILASARPARPLPEGKTWAEVIRENWPGEDSIPEP